MYGIRNQLFIAFHLGSAVLETNKQPTRWPWCAVLFRYHRPINFGGQAARTICPGEMESKWGDGTSLEHGTYSI